MIITNLIKKVQIQIEIQLHTEEEEELIQTIKLIKIKNTIKIIIIQILNKEEEKI